MSDSKKPIITAAIIGAISSILVAFITTFGTISGSQEKMKEQLEGGLLAIENKKIENLPIGTVIPSLLSSQEIMDNYGNNWVLADGREVSKKSKYFAITNNDKIPDLRAMFLRGMNGTRSDSLTDPDRGRKVGSIQTDTTALPKGSEFVGMAVDSGGHTHSFDAARDYSAAPGSHGRAKASGRAANTGSSGNHSHIVKINSGGDAETRPKNVAVYYYIKIN